jgi:alanyl-tRNA synthetase
VGYDECVCESRILRWAEVSSILKIVLDKTSFYAESGGQEADIGWLSWNDEFEIKIDNVQKEGDVFVHYGRLTKGEITDRSVIANVDVIYRSSITENHTATHLLQKALRDVLGEHIQQKGSLVSATHFSALSKDELTEIERRVNTAILEGFPVTADEMSFTEAQELGAMALFGEKYGDTVRVVRMGDSVELCGGTHLDNTAKTGAFAIVSEFSVASGVRRIEAMTGLATLDALNAARGHLSVLSGMLKTGAPEELAGKLELHMATLRELRTKVEAAISKDASGEARRILTGARELGGLKVITTVIEDVNVDVEKLRQIEDTLRDWEAGVVAVLATVKDDKVTIMAACGKVAVEKGIKAGELIREISKICGGSGGGKPDFAMGGGKDPGKLRDALDAVDGFIKEKLGERSG